MTRDPVATALNALSNASPRAVAEADLPPILATGDGPGDLVRALFGDCSFETLDRLAAAFGIPRATVRASYARAKRLHAAANADLDDGADISGVRPTPPPPPSPPARARS